MFGRPASTPAGLSGGLPQAPPSFPMPRTREDIQQLARSLMEADRLAVSFEFDNGDHNMQVLLPITLALAWA